MNPRRHVKIPVAYYVVFSSECGKVDLVMSVFTRIPALIRESSYDAAEYVALKIILK